MEMQLWEPEKILILLNQRLTSERIIDDMRVSMREREFLQGALEREQDPCGTHTHTL